MVKTLSDYLKMKKGNSAPDFSLKGTDGKIHALKSYSGKKGYLVIFMCNHCPFVKPKMDYIAELAGKYGKEIQVFGINANDANEHPEDDFATMKKVAKQKGFSFPYLVDETQEVAKAYGATCTPDPFLFDANKKLIFHGRFDDAHEQPHSMGKTQEMEDAMKQLISTGKVTIKEMPSLGCNIKWKR